MAKARHGMNRELKSLRGLSCDQDAIIRITQSKTSNNQILFWLSPSESA